MSHVRKAATAAIAALALGCSMVASTAPADAHTYSKVGTVSAKEANKLFKEAFKQKCLTVHEARHIAHGSGELTEDDPESEDYTGRQDLYFDGTKKSHILYIGIGFEDGCATDVGAVRR